MSCQYVLVKPNGIFGEQEKKLDPSQLIMNPKTPTKDCLYYDAETGLGVATVNRGTWYN
jgi:hypothetical protein